MNCYLFPGQPLAPPATLPDDDDFRAIAELAKERASFDLERFSWLGAEGTDNVKLQIYGAAMSLYRTRRLRAEGVAAQLVAEHSMGIYPALAAAGVLPEGESLELVARAGQLMIRFGRERRYALGCIVGLTLEPLLAIAENNGVYLANHNTSRHFLLSGERGNMEDACAEALARSAFSVKLFACDAPLHSPLMEELAGDFRALFADYRYREPVLPLLNHIDQDYLAAADIADFMTRELSLPVYWERSWLALRAAGASRFFEVGVGDSLKKYNRWIDSETGR